MNLQVIGVIVLLIALVALKQKFDPRSDAFRTRPRYGWRFEKAEIIDLAKYREKKIKEQSERKTA